MYALQTINSSDNLQNIKDNYSSQCGTWFKWMQDNGKGICDDSIKDYFSYLQKAEYQVRVKKRDAAGNIIFTGKGKNRKPVYEIITKKYTPAAIANKRSGIKKRVKQLFKDADMNTKMLLNFTLKEIDTEIKKTTALKSITEKCLNKEEYENLLNKCRSDRQRCFIMFLFETGCRINELTGAELVNCITAPESGKVFIKVTGKGDKQRVVKIDKDLFDYITSTFNGKKYLIETSSFKRYDNGYISKQIHKLGLLIGKNISAHCLRHSAATELIKKFPGQIKAVSLYLGHSSISTTLDFYYRAELTDDELSVLKTISRKQRVKE